MFSKELEEIKDWIDQFPNHYVSQPVKEFLGEVAGEVKSLRERAEKLEARLEELERSAVKRFDPEAAQPVQSAPTAVEAAAQAAEKVQEVQG